GGDLVGIDDGAADQHSVRGSGIAGDLVILPEELESLLRNVVEILDLERHDGPSEWSGLGLDRKDKLNAAGSAMDGDARRHGQGDAGTDGAAYTPAYPLLLIGIVRGQGRKEIHRGFGR